MLDFIHQFANGFIAVPLVDCWQKYALAEQLSSLSVPTLSNFAKKLKANPGVLQIMLNRLVILNWVKVTEGQYQIISTKEMVFPYDVPTLYRYDFEAALFEGKLIEQFVSWVNNITYHLHEDESWNTFIKGALLIQVFTAFNLVRLTKAHFMECWETIHNKAKPALLSFLFSCGITNSPQKLVFTAMGDFILSKLSRFGVVASYRLLIAQLNKLLFEDVKEVLSSLSDEEQHLDRQLNVIASGLQHQKYFDALEKIILPLFDHHDFLNQPHYLADLGCGDGSLLKQLHDAIRTKTARGKVLQQYPLRLLALDYNLVALKTAAENLKNLPFDIMLADISQPVKLQKDLSQIGINSQSILHIRSFIDHERAINISKNIHAIAVANEETLLAIDDNGEVISTELLIQSLIAHFQQWQSILNQHGLILLEVHAISSENTRQFLNQSESFYFDFTQAISKQYLVRAEQFHLAAAAAGLFIKSNQLMVYPDAFPFARITLCHFIKENFCIRQATQTDFTELLALEELCWPEFLKLSEIKIQQRLIQFPAGQFVIVKNNKVIGCLYTQRIADVANLSVKRFSAIEALHVSTGQHLQLLSINIHPAYQDEGLGDKLRLFALHHARLLPGIISVVGVTRCSHYDGSQPYENYVYAKDRNGLSLDPTVRFHLMRNAYIIKLIEQYRPEDQANLGHGILIEYKLHLRNSILQDNPVQTLMPAEKTALLQQIMTHFFAKKQLALLPKTPLRDCGFDSLELMELRYTLERYFNRKLDASFLFTYPTVEHIEALLTTDFKSEQAVNSIHLLPTKTEVEVFDRTKPCFIGMACVFPGSQDLAAFWQCLQNSSNVISQTILQRWQLKQSFLDAKILQQIAYAGLLPNYSGFDEAFFNISPREAALMDPQQRLLLMCTWHALEHAGIPPKLLRGKSVGAFVGCCAHDFAQVSSAFSDNEPGYYATGSAISILAGRLSYYFDWHGPAITIDTACSSSLVALSLAQQAIENGQCEIAIVAGVNLLLSPDLSISYANAGMLSQVGKCQTFDAQADGYVRSEGIAVCVLASNAYARSHHHRILGTLESVAVNHDGLSNGLTAPNALAQQKLIKQALQAAQCEFNDIDYIETHGTGTPLGDPIEISAIASIMQLVQRDNPCVLGAVKSVIGHTEGAAGLAGVIKILLAMSHEQIPPNSNFTKLNSEIQLDSERIIIATTPVPWKKKTKKLRYAGVSSFGFSGTNAHAIISDKDCHKVVTFTNQLTNPQAKQDFLVCFSAKTVESLQNQLKAYVNKVDKQLPLFNIAYTNNCKREHFSHRFAVLSDSTETLIEKTKNYLSESASFSKDIFVSTERKSALKLGFLFTGQGSQYAGMGHACYQGFSIFRYWIDYCEGLYDALASISLKSILWGDQINLLSQTEYTQPCLFCLEYAFAQLWISLGIQPAVLIGHSIGEYAAACIAKVMTLEEGLKLIHARGSLMAKLCLPGGMLAVYASAEQLLPLLVSFDKIAIAAVNTPNQVVISGAVEQIKSIEQVLNQAGLRFVPLSVSHGFHSPTMEPMLEEFKNVAMEINYLPAHIPIYNTVNTLPVEAFIDANYWVEHIRATVNFMRAFKAVEALGLDGFIEIGPAPTLIRLGQSMIANNHTYQWLTSTKPGDQRLYEIQRSLGICYAAGAEINWDNFFQDIPAEFIDLPNYAFQLTNYPIHKGVLEEENNVNLQVQTLTFSSEEIALLSQHNILGQKLMPAAFYLAYLICEQGDKIPSKQFLSIKECLFENKLLFPLDVALLLQKQQTDASTRYQFIKSTEQPTPVVLSRMFTQMIERNSRLEETVTNDFADWPSISIHHIYERLVSLGYNYQDNFRILNKTYYQLESQSAYAEIIIDEKKYSSRFQLTRAIDAGLQLLVWVALQIDQAISEIYFPYRIAQCIVNETYQEIVGVHVNLTRFLAEGFIGDVQYYNKEGAISIQLKDVLLKRRSVDYIAYLKWIKTPLPQASTVNITVGHPILLFVNQISALEGWLTGFGLNRKDVIPIVFGESYEKQQDYYQLNPHRVDEFVQLFNAFPSTTQIIYTNLFENNKDILSLSLTEFSSETLLTPFTNICIPLLNLAKAMQQIAKSYSSVFVTQASMQNSMSSLSGIDDFNIAGSVAMLKSFALELAPRVTVQLIEIDKLTPNLLTMEQQVNLPGSNQISYINQTRYMLTPVSLNFSPVSETTDLTLLKKGTVLVTGGLGQLGLLTIEALIEMGYQNIALIARSSSREAMKRIEGWRADGVNIVINMFDACDYAKLSTCIESINQTAFPLIGIIHCAGVLQDAALLNQSADTFMAVYRPKVLVAWYLHALTQKQKLAFFICYSSITAIIGQAGQSNYALANACLNELMALRHRQGLVGLSVCWGPWLIGMTKTLINNGMRFELSNFEWISLSQGKSLIKQLLVHVKHIDQPTLLATYQNWQALAEARTKKNNSFYFVTSTAESIVKSYNPLVKNEIDNQASWLGVSREQLLDKMRHLAAKILRINDPTKITTTYPLKDYGLDSLSAIELRDEINLLTKLVLPDTLLFDFPSIDKLADYILSLQNNTSEISESEIITGDKLNTQIAIIGAACRFPGQADNLDAFWQLLSGGKNGIVEMVNQRWNMSQYFSEGTQAPGKMNVRHFGLIQQVDRFDADFFNITPKEAVHLDPQQRLLLELTWETLECAGYTATMMRGSATGVFIGIMNHDYMHLNHSDVLGDSAKHSAYYASGEAFSAAAGRIAYFFDWNGPAMAVDTACSSALVALHLACQSILTGESAQAIAAGINLILSPEVAIESASANMLSSSGKCHTFDQKADGYVRAEGAGVVLLKSYAQALRDKDTILGIICATAINQDGRSQGLTAPNGQAQQKLIKQALTRAQLRPEQINYIEAHGTGTPLGDPIELSALQAIYAKSRSTQNKLYVASVKTNIGHTESAAGIAGLIKVLLMFRHHAIPPHLNLEKLNKSIQLAPHVCVPQKLEPWQLMGESRRAAVSAFGFSGTNAHIIVQEPDQLTVETREATNTTPLLFKFSAKNAHALRLLLQKFYDFFASNQDNVLNDVSYTLACGREDFAVRFVVVTDNYQDLMTAILNKLNVFHEKTDNNKIILSDQKHTDVLAALIQQYQIDNISVEEKINILRKITALYEAGFTIPWQRLFAKVNGRRIILPSYAFNKQSYWVNDSVPDQPSLEANYSYEITWEEDLSDGLATITDWHLDEMPIEILWLDFDKERPSRLSEKNFYKFNVNNLLAFLNNREKVSLLKSTKKIILNLRSLFTFEEIYNCYYLILQFMQLLAQNKRELKIIVLLQQETADIQYTKSASLSFMLQPIVAMFQVFHLEYPNFQVNIIGVDDDYLDKILQIALREFYPIFEIVVWRGGRRYFKRLRPMELNKFANIPIQTEGAYLITGGTSGLGLLTAEVLVELGARNLILISRSGIKNDQDAKRIAHMRAQGKQIEISQVDVTDQTALSQFLQQIETRYVIKGVIHSAGLIHDMVLINQTPDNFKQVLLPKVNGGWNLHWAFKDKSLDFFILYSSIASVIGNAGQINYTAANAFLDGLANYRRALGLPALSINWGAWEKMGVADTPMVIERLQQQGIGLIALSEGKNAIKTIFKSSKEQIIYANINWNRLANARSKQALWANLVRGQINDTNLPMTNEDKIEQVLVERLLNSNVQTRLKIIEEIVFESLTKISGIKPEQIDKQRGFMEMGLDSLMVIEIKNNLQKILGLDLPTTLLFDQATPAKLIAFLAKSFKQSHDEKDTDLNAMMLSDRDISDLSDEEALATLNQFLD